MSSKNDDSTRRSMSGSAADAGRNTVDAAVAKTQDAAEGVAGIVASAVEAATDATQSLVSESRDEIAAGIQKTSQALDDARVEALETTRTHPVRTILVVAVLAAVGGFALGVVRSR